MQNKTVNALIPLALPLVEAQLQEDNKIPKVYNGYISSMGASLNQSGLLPTLAIFSADDSEDEGDRRKLMRILTDLLRAQWPERYAELAGPGTDKTERRLLLFAAKHRDNRPLLRAIRRDLINASIAVKLSLRTFNLVKK